MADHYGLGADLSHPVVTLVCDDLTAHPRNYRTHPPDQLDHIKASIQRHGFYRNVVVAEDNTILAGHGVVQAARALGLTTVPGIRLPIDPFSVPALQILTGDNQIGLLGIVDDRALTELLKELRAQDPDNLKGTGLNDEQLAALVMVTRAATEIADKNEAAEWLGMPDYADGSRPLKIIVSFRNAEDRRCFAEQLGVEITEKTHSLWWPEQARDDPSAVYFQSSEERA